MTSLEIAELTGKQHKNVMQAIRNMEPAWKKVTGLKFQLCEKYYPMANGVMKKQPFYSLTKTECLYIATKFNDEARAKLVLRWEQLEMAERERQLAEMQKLRPLVDLSGSCGSQANIVVVLADGRMLPLPEWRPYHGPVRELVCRTAHGIVRRGTDDYTLYVRLPKTFIEALDATPAELFDMEVAHLLSLM